METTKPQENQNIFDISLQEYGSIEKVFDLLEDNDQFNLTDDISVYEDLKIGREAFKKDIVEYYNARNLKPATAITDEEQYLLDNFSGIDYMIIEDDFIIY
ncbi:hypothetical protein ACHRV1_05025 [Flavobacterium aquidurense]|jgi:hypothetical protein|uniref:hypothetical protein n=1 Tax=Flavobacterium aquidurense TaxID=362413 RepID=UPI000933D6AF|nr:hypothetical protein [Flavobacterium aquidurense]OXA71712.1 hypothetical protein B0A67_10160 [Flavobacterium aquidurense]